MHYQRTLGILETLFSRYAADYGGSVSDLARTAAETVSLDGLTVTVCPGYLDIDAFLYPALEAFHQGDYDAALSVLPPAEMAPAFGNVRLGVIDSYNTRNFQLFGEGKLDYIVGKYSSIVGPSFALMLNAVTGYVPEFRENGRALKAAQSFWISDSKQDYDEKYALSNSAAFNAYNFEDLSRVCKIFNPEAACENLIVLAEACSFDAVMARRG